MDRAIELLGPWTPVGAVVVIAVGALTALLKVVADFRRALTEDRRSRIEENRIILDMHREQYEALRRARDDFREEFRELKRRFEEVDIRMRADFEAVGRWWKDEIDRRQERFAALAQQAEEARALGDDQRFASLVAEMDALDGQFQALDHELDRRLDKVGSDMKRRLNEPFFALALLDWSKSPQRRP